MMHDTKFTMLSSTARVLKNVIVPYISWKLIKGERLAYTKIKYSKTLPSKLGDNDLLCGN